MPIERNLTFEELLNQIFFELNNDVGNPTQAMRELALRCRQHTRACQYYGVEISQFHNLEKFVRTIAEELSGPADEAIEEILLVWKHKDMLLSDFLDTQFWRDWDENNRQQFMVSDPDRGRRCWEAAAEGSDGSTHQEIIGDFREAIQDAVRDGVIASSTAYRLEHETDRLEHTHELAGTLSNQGG